MNGTKKELVESFLESKENEQYVSETGDKIPEKVVQRCICPCMRQGTLNQCACKVCVGFKLALQAWDKERNKWHKDTPCKCSGCSHKESFEAYMAASKSPSAFRKACCCPKKEYPDLALPHLPDTIPEFYDLSCCKVEDRKPSHLETCEECGWDQKLYWNPGSCIEHTDDKVKWKEWQDTQDGDHVRSVLRIKEGTRAELLQFIRRLHRKYLYHKWIDQITRHQEQLDVATFNGKDTTICKVDFAAKVNLDSEATGCCEFNTTSNLYVALILHSPGEIVVGEERPVVCDVFRMYTNAKPSALVHQHAMQLIAAHYKKKIQD